MNKRKGIAVIVIFILLSMTVSQVFAAGPSGAAVKKTPGVDQPDQPEVQKTARAEKAENTEAKNPGNGSNPGKQDHPNKPDKPEKPVKAEKPEKADKPDQPSGSEKTDKVKQKAIHFHGEIVSLTESDISVKSESEEVSLSVDGNTRIHFPTLGKDNETGDLRVGMKVTGKAIEQEDGTYLALSIQVIPGKPAKIHHVGLVSEYESGANITVRGKDGSTTTFLITQDTRILPKDDAALLQPGMYVTIISPATSPAARRQQRPS